MIVQEKEFTGFKISGFLAIFIGLLLGSFCIFLITMEIDPYKVVSLVIMTIIPIMINKGQMAMVSNLLAVLCADDTPQPIINAE